MLLKCVCSYVKLGHVWRCGFLDMQIGCYQFAPNQTESCNVEFTAVDSQISVLFPASELLCVHLESPCLTSVVMQRSVLLFSSLSLTRCLSNKQLSLNEQCSGLEDRKEDGKSTSGCKLLTAAKLHPETLIVDYCLP